MSQACAGRWTNEEKGRKRQIFAQGETQKCTPQASASAREQEPWVFRGDGVHPVVPLEEDP